MDTGRPTVPVHGRGPDRSFGAGSFVASSFVASRFVASRFVASTGGASSDVAGKVRSVAGRPTGATGARSGRASCAGETTRGDLLAGLTPAQHLAVTVDAAPLCVLAGAGAGKTRVLTRRIAHRVATGSAGASHVLVITFTRKAAGEIGHRLSDLGLRDRVQAGTFHAVAAAQLRRWWADRGLDAPALLERKARLLGPLVAARPVLAGVPLGELAGHLEWAKARLIGPDTFEAAASSARRVLPVPAEALASLYRRYEDEKRRQRVIDFEDLLGRCADAFEADPELASAQRWRWRHVFVDEFQDVNPLQHRLLLSWLGASTDLCVVGDPNQAIYSWNGADPRLLERIGERWPSTTVVHLDDNHRCTPQIVASAATVLGAEGRHLRSSRADGPAPTVRSYASDAAEAQGVASALRSARARGLAWSEMAVLVRTNAQVVALCEAMEQASVPHRAPGRVGLVDDPAVASVVAEWRRTPRRPVQMAVADLEQLLAGGGEHATDPATGGGGGGGGGDHHVPQADEAAASLRALVDLARSFERFEGPGTVDGFVAWARAAGGDGPGPDDAVTVCSFHRSKGLEWKAVWVCGLEAGLVPIGRADSAAATDEERRLLYVALTRAETYLECSWSQTRRFGAKAVSRSPSPWLAAISSTTSSTDPAMIGTGAEPEAPLVLGAEQWRTHLASQRARLREQQTDLEQRRSRSDPPAVPGPAVQARRRRRGEPMRVTLSEPDRGVVDAITRWRASVARASGVPAHVVLHDRTIEALASLRPMSNDGLLAVPGVGPVKAARYGPTLLALLVEDQASA